MRWSSSFGPRGGLVASAAVLEPGGELGGVAGVLLLPLGESLRELCAEGARRLLGLVDLLVELLEVAPLAPRPDAEDRLPLNTGEVAYDLGRRPEVEPGMLSPRGCVVKLLAHPAPSGARRSCVNAAPLEPRFD